MGRYRLEINGSPHNLDAEAEMPLLWVLRDVLNLTGTKYGCGIGLCGACTVHLDGEATRSCQVPVSSAVGKQILTIEGLGAGGSSAVQRAWIEEQVPQCGYCQPGQVMSAQALLAKNPVRQMLTSMTRWAGICVDVPPTSVSGRPFIVRRRRCTHEDQSARISCIVYRSRGWGGLGDRVSHAHFLACGKTVQL
jgi:isoquinoline 1-oxidoreductase alpha subunit